MTMQCAKQQMKSRYVFTCNGQYIWLMLVCLGCIVSQSMWPVHAADQVITRDKTLFGKIEAVTSEAVRLLRRGSTGDPQEINVSDILMIQFDDEPQELIESKRRLVKNEFEAALHAVEKINENQIEESSVAIRGEYAYVQAVAAGRIAIKTADGIPSSLRRVEKVIDQFTRSIHHYELLELAGDLEVAQGRADKAQEFYDKMIEGPPLIALRAKRLSGNVLASEDRHLEAIRALKKVQSENLDLNGVEQEKIAACLDQATSLIALSRSDEAVSLIQEMLLREFPEEVPISSAEELLGKAHCLLGQSFIETGKNQEALIAYLTVDLVYNTNPDIHAESLLQLIELWTQGGYPRRAAEAREKLVNSYPENAAATQFDSSPE